MNLDLHGWHTCLFVLFCQSSIVWHGIVWPLSNSHKISLVLVLLNVKKINIKVNHQRAIFSRIAHWTFCLHFKIHYRTKTKTIFALILWVVYIFMEYVVVNYCYGSFYQWLWHWQGTWSDFVRLILMDTNY